MPVLDRCWTPFQVYSWTTVKMGSYYAAVYTGVLHILTTVYAIYVMQGGRSEWFFGPYFELDKADTYSAGIFTIVFSICFILTTIMLQIGLSKDNRCLFFPWFIGMILEILLMVAVGLWFIARYYRNHLVFQIYCLLCVISQYQVVKSYQEPQFVILYP
ncbi:uncharacterized protein LOC106468583 [Limulus polyphemus]|uniref:Uncharacterized protein LOC106468583 n=1 Tax=Limulus polyphemus TaxID=6850 RepID=A0ABM1T9S7_LIMPO|nr:uncharacterized protein LOC106468583 [Limulus polyphemus]